MVTALVGPASCAIARTALPGMGNSIPRIPPGILMALEKKPSVPAGGMNLLVSEFMPPRISSDSPSGTVKPFISRLPLTLWMSAHVNTSGFDLGQSEKFGKAAVAELANSSDAPIANSATRCLRIVMHDPSLRNIAGRCEHA